MKTPDLIQLVYMAAVVLFILGLKLLNSPRTARRGNALASLGMFIAILATLFTRGIITPWMIVVGLVIGSIAGGILAVKIEMTAMPQLVALFNGFGGLASGIVGIAEFLHTDGWSHAPAAGLPASVLAFTTGLSVLIGAVTFTGSMVAYGKLEGLKITPSGSVTFPGRLAVSAAVLLASLYLCVVFAQTTGGIWLFLIMVLSLLLGIAAVMPIGGADMPVVISLLNSYSGLAACATGFVLENQLLIVAGALVGASGLILTQIMCKAMNRSLANVLVGGFGESASGASSGGAKKEKRSVADYDVYDAAAVLESAQSVVIVPGYGLAVAQAQHTVRELDNLLTAKGAKVRYAIHPVAGRMPGHMNVLLAEADVPYDKLIEMDDINPDFVETDVALVLGANDVTNPAARDDASSPIYGMPILEVDKAATVMIVKRSLSPGYAGIDNELFYAPKTMMLFGDAKKMVADLIDALK